MCGIAGYLTLGHSIQKGIAENILQGMANALSRRGPDSAGYWYDSVSGVGISHRRLSIVDLSSAGSQPMCSSCGRYVIVFNGEIYNNLELRNTINKRFWRGYSDTETLLECFSVWGIRLTLERCIGMFAMAIWDKKDRVLIIARDRIGEKPLYYGWHRKGVESCFLFGSDLGAIKAYPDFDKEIDRNALALYMRYNCIPDPYSIYKDIYKLKPGYILTISLYNHKIISEQYWSLNNVAEAGISNSFAGSENEAVNNLEILLKDSIRKQMIADVPLGAFLSGGVDSSTVVALMQSQSTRQIKTFTIGFDEKKYNEAYYAKSVAQYLHTDHTELYVTPEQAMNVIPKLASLYSEPFSDSSQIPTFLLSQLARQKVTVSLSGDGGDELFGGYNRYIQGYNSWRILSHIPIMMRKLVADKISYLSPNAWNSLYDKFRYMIPSKLQMANFGEKFYKVAKVLPSRTIDDVYLGLTTHWDPVDLVVGSKNLHIDISNEVLPFKNLSDVHRMMLLDGITYLPNDILVKIDRAAMGVSLETRVPFLDHRIVEFAWHLPENMKLRNGLGKWALRQVLYKYVPKELIERPKMGFGVPIDNWLRGPLREWAEYLLNEKTIRDEGFLNPDPIRHKWNEHLTGKRNWQHHLWDVLMFQSWLKS